MATSRINEVKAPQHFKTPRSHDGIEPLRGLEALDGLARHGADVGPSMALDLRHVPQTTDAKPVELPPERLGDGRTNRRLARSWRSY